MMVQVTGLLTSPQEIWILAPGFHPDTTGIWGVDQSMEALSLFLCLNIIKMLKKNQGAVEQNQPSVDKIECISLGI